MRERGVDQHTADPMKRGDVCSARFSVSVLCHSPPSIPAAHTFPECNKQISPTRPHNQSYPSLPFSIFPMHDPRKHGCGENDPNGPVFDPVHGVIHHFYQVRSGRDTEIRCKETHTRANERQSPATPARKHYRARESSRRHHRNKDDIERRRCYAYTDPTLQTYDSHWRHPR